MHLTHDYIAYIAYNIVNRFGAPAVHGVHVQKTSNEIVLLHSLQTLTMSWSNILCFPHDVRSNWMLHVCNHCNRWECALSTYSFRSHSQSIFIRKVLGSDFAYVHICWMHCKMPSASPTSLKSHYLRHTTEITLSECPHVWQSTPRSQSHIVIGRRIMSYRRSLPEVWCDACYFRHIRFVKYITSNRINFVELWRFISYFRVRRDG